MNLVRSLTGEQQKESYIEKLSIIGNTIVGVGSGQNSSTAIYLHPRSSPTTLINVLKVSIVGNIITGFNRGTILSGKDITFIGNVIHDVQVGIWSSSPYRAVIASNEIYGAGTDTADWDGIRLNGANKVIVQGNHIENFYCGITETYTEYPNGDYHIIKNNRIENIGAGGAIEKIGTNTIVSQNIGFATENSGTATIPNGQTSVTVAHGLAGTPTSVVLGPTHAEVADAVWSADDTNITITVPSAVTADRQISWYAEYKP